MQEQTVISCRGLVKDYPLFSGSPERLRALLFPRYRPAVYRALDGVDFSMRRGEIVGLIGLNGSGKSTLAGIIAGITHPTRGEVEVHGRVDMLAAGCGMDPNLTGRENISYKCLLLGMTPAGAEAIRGDIIRFADIGAHIDQPLRTCSTGMRARLGFAISIHIDPDILLIDEALSVGDGSFGEKCIARMMDFKARGKTILFVSHSVANMANFCDRIVWLHRGSVVGEDLPPRIIPPYCGFAREAASMSLAGKEGGFPSLADYQRRYLQEG